jgi:predicted nucleic acid-binding protein
MRDDLLDAQASVDWAVTQIETVKDEFIRWDERRPYRIFIENDSQSGDDLLIAQIETPLPLQLSAAVGSIINSIRTSLDILASALARRNGKKPSSGTHFPICTLDTDFLKRMQDIEIEKWLSASEVAEIKALKPHKGGDDSIWPMHQLDILRKHERLVTVAIDISGFVIRGPKSMHLGGPKSIIKRLDDKTILSKANPSDAERFAKGDAQAFIDIQLNESAIGLTDEPVIRTLRRFASRASYAISRFDI